MGRPSSLRAKGRVLTEDLREGAQPGLVAAEDRQAFCTGRGNLRGFIGTVHGRGRGSRGRSAVVKLVRLLASAALRTAAHVGGTLPAGLVLLGLLLLIGLHGHGLAFFAVFVRGFDLVSAS